MNTMYLYVAYLNYCSLIRRSVKYPSLNISYQKEYDKSIRDLDNISRLFYDAFCNSRLISNPYKQCFKKSK
jgi:hypothetical protein